MGLACLLGGVAAKPGARSVPPPVVLRYIHDLDAADPTVREKATEALATADARFNSPAVRRAAIAALPGATPEARGRLLDVLLRVPEQPWDPPASADPGVKLAFTGYAAADADERLGRVAALQGSGSVDALFHVLTADPNGAVRWAAANALRLTFYSDAREQTPEALAAVDVRRRVLALVDPPGGGDAAADAAAGPLAYPAPADNGPLLAAAAWAVQTSDPARADQLFGRALAIEADHPAAFRGQADFAYLWTADRAVSRLDYPAALDLYRQWAARTAWSDDEVPDAVGDLFALQAEHGPFPGLADDARAYRPYLGRPELLYCLARLAGRQGSAWGPAKAAVTAAAIDAAALAAGGTSFEEHRAVGLFLYRHNRPVEAEREFRLGLLLCGPQEAINLYFALATLTADSDDDAAAGYWLEAALRHSMSLAGMSRVDRYGRTTAWTEADAWAEVHWHYLRADETAGDHPAALAEARQLLALEADGQAMTRNPGIAADAVPVLVAAGQQADADHAFQTAYDKLTADVAAGRVEAKNDLAWLCARCDRHMPEADRLSAEAVAAFPADAACLDTRAEVLLRLGRPKEAVGLELRAVGLKPSDVYMQRQLDRFRRAAAQPGR